jgi:protein translocase SecG subunit
MLYYLAVTLYVLACLMLLLVVLLQQGKGGDMASAFGGGGSQTAFGARAGASVRRVRRRFSGCCSWWAHWCLPCSANAGLDRC